MFNFFNFFIMDTQKYKGYTINKRGFYGSTSYFYDVLDKDGFPIDDHGFISIADAKRGINELLKRKNKNSNIAGLF